MDEDDYEIASRVLASKHRVNVLIALLDGEKTPTELADQFNEHQPTISRALSELKEMELVESTSQQRGRLYWISSDKKYIAEYLESRNE